MSSHDFYLATARITSNCWLVNHTLLPFKSSLRILDPPKEALIQPKPKGCLRRGGQIRRPGGVPFFLKVWVVKGVFFLEFLSSFGVSFGMVGSKSTLFSSQFLLSAHAPLSSKHVFLSWNLKRSTVLCRVLPNSLHPFRAHGICRFEVLGSPQHLLHFLRILSCVLLFYLPHPFGAQCIRRRGSYSILSVLLGIAFPFLFLLFCVVQAYGLLLGLGVILHI